MTTTKQDSTADLKVTERVVQGPGPGRGPFGGGMVGQKAGNFWASGRRLLARMRPYRPLALSVVMLTFVSVTLNAFGPWVLGRATDLIFAGLVGGKMPTGVTKEQVIDRAAIDDPDRVDLLRKLDFTPGVGVDFSAVAQVLGWVLVLYAASAAFALISAYVLNLVVQKTVRTLRADVEDKVNVLPLSFFDRQPRGELLSRVTNDIDNVSQTLQQGMSQLLNSLFMVASVLAMMIWISPLLALVALISVPVAVSVSGAIMKRSQKLFIAQWRKTGVLNSQIEETFTGHDLVKVFGRRAAVGHEFDQENRELYRASFGAQFASGMIMPVMFFIGNLSYVAIAVIGGLRVAAGSISIGDVQAFIQYSRQFNQPLTQLASMANILQSGVASAERVFELLDAEEQVPEATTLLTTAETACGKVRCGEVRFEEVEFSYQPEQPLIRNLNLVARPGETVAIVGPTGAGKTTLVNLMMRFYELDSGRITLDGVDIADLRRADLRGQIGMVLQETWLFAGTIRENIAYGSPNASEEEIRAAAKATFVDRFVQSLPHGYDTVLDEEGSNLSAGERQLITIARAFLTDPALLILDEATSSVDTRTELLVQQAMAALRSDRTSFVIAHRLSTIRDADMIVVMQDGTIVDQGNHESLLARPEGLYAQLYAAQFAAAADYDQYDQALVGSPGVS
jgi:ATP-binding cassette, subfamily B, multidrug efflux pump